MGASTPGGASKKWAALAATLGVAVLGVGAVAARAVVREGGDFNASLTGATRATPAARAPSAQAAQAAANQRRLERLLGVGGNAAPEVIPAAPAPSRALPEGSAPDEGPSRPRDVVREHEAVNLVRSHGSLGSCMQVARLRNPAGAHGRARLVIDVAADGRLGVRVLGAPDEHLGLCIERGANGLRLAPGAAVTAETELDLQ
ncbi:MAG: hypothetical protein U0324_22765 [Polyangiales bacterium]